MPHTVGAVDHGHLSLPSRRSSDLLHLHHVRYAPTGHRMAHRRGDMVMHAFRCCTVPPSVYATGAHPPHTHRTAYYDQSIDAPQDEASIKCLLSHDPFQLLENDWFDGAHRSAAAVCRTPLELSTTGISLSHHVALPIYCIYIT